MSFVLSHWHYQSLCIFNLGIDAMSICWKQKLLFCWYNIMEPYWYFCRLYIYRRLKTFFVDHPVTQANTSFKKNVNLRYPKQPTGHTKKLCVIFKAWRRGFPEWKRYSIHSNRNQLLIFIPNKIKCIYHKVAGEFDNTKQTVRSWESRPRRPQVMNFLLVAPG